MEFLRGKKSFIIMIATVAYGVLGMALGHIDQTTAFQLILGGLGLGALRDGIKNG